MDGQAHAIVAQVEHPADVLQVLSCDTFAAITRRSSQHYRCMEHMHASTGAGMYDVVGGKAMQGRWGMEGKGRGKIREG